MFETDFCQTGEAEAFRTHQPENCHFMQYGESGCDNTTLTQTDIRFGHLDFIESVQLLTMKDLVLLF